MRIGNICRNELRDRRMSVSLVVQEQVLCKIQVMALSLLRTRGIRHPDLFPPPAGVPGNTVSPQ